MSASIGSFGGHPPPRPRFPKPPPPGFQWAWTTREETVTVIAKPGGKAPDYIEPMLGWRSWRICDSVLRSVAQSDFVWPVKPHRATCLAGGIAPELAFWYESFRKHQAPHTGCACGYYATKTYLQLMEQLPYHNFDFFVTGIVAVWGRVIEYTRGYRAEYAHPVLLIGMPATKLSFYARHLKKIAKAYRVPTYMTPRYGSEGWREFMVALHEIDGPDGPNLDEITKKVIIPNRLKDLSPSKVKPPWVQ